MHFRSSHNANPRFRFNTFNIFFQNYSNIITNTYTLKALSGDLEGAKRTQEKFIIECPVVAQVTSVVQVASGDAEAARKTQEHFASNGLDVVEGIVDALPGIGHAKGGIHYAMGNKSMCLIFVILRELIIFVYLYICCREGR